MKRKTSRASLTVIFTPFPEVRNRRDWERSRQRPKSAGTRIKSSITWTWSKKLYLMWVACQSLRLWITTFWRSKEGSGGRLCSFVLGGIYLEFDLKNRLQKISYESRLMVMALILSLKWGKSWRRGEDWKMSYIDLIHIFLDIVLYLCNWNNCISHF